MTKRTPTPPSAIPRDAVLLIPEPESGQLPTQGVKPGYYNSKQLLQLLATHRTDAAAIQFIADMLESGDQESDTFARLLRENAHDADALAVIIASCKT